MIENNGGGVESAGSSVVIRGSAKAERETIKDINFKIEENDTHQSFEPRTPDQTPG